MMNNDTISRQAAIEVVNNYEIDAPDYMTEWAQKLLEAFKGDIRGLISELPSAQPEIIRCKDCKYHEDEEPGMVYCPNQVGGWVSEDFFCKDGKRRDE